MSENLNFLQYIWSLFLIPVGFVATKYVNLSNRVTKNETEIRTLKEGVENLCKKHDETNNLLRELIGRFDEHTRK